MCPLYDSVEIVLSRDRALKRTVLSARAVRSESAIYCSSSRAAWEKGGGEGTVGVEGMEERGEGTMTWIKTLPPTENEAVHEALGRLAELYPQEQAPERRADRKWRRMPRHHLGPTFSQHFQYASLPQYSELRT